MPAFTRRPAVKLVLAWAVAAILAVPLFMVYLLVYDRENQSQTARASIAQGWGGPQQLAGPLIVLPYSVQRTETVKENGKDVQRTVTDWDSLYLAPATLKIDTRLDPQKRQRSIYQAVLYEGQARGRAVYRIPADFARLGIKPEQIAFDRAELRFGLSDPRGLKSDNQVTINGVAATPQPGNGTAATGGRGFFVGFDASPLKTGVLTADFQFGFRGHTDITLQPSAGLTEWHVASTWPHPSFTGGFLPESHDIKGSGFTATYRISNLALGETLIATQELKAQTVVVPDVENYGVRDGRGQQVADPGSSIRIGLIEPVDLYAQINRSVKYGFLFIGFTFMAFLMFDVVGGRHVSPIEYLLVGAGLILFFVMLLAFAEIVGFLLAYLIAAGAIVALLTAYSASVLASWRRGGAIAALLASLYGVLYVLLGLEDYSLMIGSLLLFAALAAVMYLTRNLEWGGGESTAPES
jgi:inner membrane protein